jgi:hypothetical protein
MCAEPGNQPTKDAAGNDIPANALPFRGNMTWAMLKEVTPDVGVRTLAMNLVGTVIYYPDAKAAAIKPELAEKNKATAGRPPRQVPPLIDLQQLIAGTETDSPLGDGNIQLSLWKCNDEDQCLNPTLEQVTVRSFLAMVQENMRELRKAIAEHQPLSQELLAFVDGTNLPVARMMALGQAKSSHTPEHLINTYGELIALNSASLMVDSLLQQFLTASTNQYAFSAQQEEARLMLIDAARQRRQQLYAEEERARGRVADFNNVEQVLASMERNLYGAAWLQQMPKHGAGSGARW